VTSATGMTVKHLKKWLVDMKCKEAKEGVEGLGDPQQLFVALLQAVWEHGTVPTQMIWMIIVLLLRKGGGGATIMVLAYLTPFVRL
jgi:hypothetical protein